VLDALLASSGAWSHAWPELDAHAVEQSASPSASRKRDESMSQGCHRDANASSLPTRKSNLIAVLGDSIDARYPRGRPGVVLRLRKDPVPRALLEDLLAIARMLYRTWRGAQVPHRKLQQLTVIGHKLCTALELGKAPVATQEHAQAWQLAEEATEELGRLVGSDTRVISLVAAAFQKLDRTPERRHGFQERDEAKRWARRQRS
jgi:hypothetical protein